MASLTAQQLTGLDIASQRVKRGATYAGFATDTKNLNYAKSTYGYSYTAKKKQGITDPIPAMGLGVGNNYDQLNKILGANIQPNQLSSDTAGLLSLSGADTKSKGDYDQLTGQLTGLMKDVGGQGADLQVAYDAQGVGNAVNQVKELNLKAAQLQGEIGKFDAETEQIKSNIGEQAIPTGLIQGQQAQLNEQRTLAHNAKVAELMATTALSQAFQGNATLGMELAQKAVDMKYAPMYNQIEVLKTQIGIAKENMSREDSKRAEIINAIATEQKTKLETAKAVESDINKLMVEAASNGAPMDVITQMRNSKSTADAIKYGRQYMAAKKSPKVETDPLKMSGDTLNSDYHQSLMGLRGRVSLQGETDSEGNRMQTREEAAKYIYNYYGKKIPLDKIKMDIYDTYEG